MTTKRRRSLAMLAKMRRLKQKGKGKQKVMWDGRESANEAEAELVTFIKLPKEEEDERIECVQFHLENGRLDVCEVLKHLSASKVQFERTPGVWHELTSLRTGKSTTKFRNRQEVFFRSTGLDTAWPWQGQWVDKWFVNGDDRDSYCSRVSRLYYKSPGHSHYSVVGTTIHFENPHGLILTAHHCCTYKDSISGETITRRNLCAFNSPVEVVYLSENYDLAFLLLKTGPYVGGFCFATRNDEQRGREVRMLSFPWHVDHAYDNEYNDVQPTEVYGHIANLGPKERKTPLYVDALATYMGGFAASPGGAVTLNSQLLVGMHVRAIWHQKGELILPFKGPPKATTRAEQSSRKRHGNNLHNQVYATTTNQKREVVEGAGDEGEWKSYEKPHEVTNTFEAQSATHYKEQQRKCSMYHGYLSTYLSAHRIQAEYEEFIASWRQVKSRKKEINSQSEDNRFCWDSHFEDSMQETHPKIRNH